MERLVAVGVLQCVYQQPKAEQVVRYVVVVGGALGIAIASVCSLGYALGLLLGPYVFGAGRG